VVEHPWVTVGFTAFVLLIPLALTSTKGWIRRLGRRWQVLHRLVYVSAASACLHFAWKVKVIIGEPVYSAAILAALLAFRLLWKLRSQQGAVRRQPAQA
jgi:sulfoxide reductase heme-binding subunit YedZ